MILRVFEIVEGNFCAESCWERKTVSNLWRRESLLSSVGRGGCAIRPIIDDSLADWTGRCWAWGNATAATCWTWGTGRWRRAVGWASWPGAVTCCASSTRDWRRTQPLATRIWPRSSADWCCTSSATWSTTGITSTRYYNDLVRFFCLESTGNGSSRFYGSGVSTIWPPLWSWPTWPANACWFPLNIVFVQEILQQQQQQQNCNAIVVNVGPGGSRTGGGAGRRHDGASVRRVRQGGAAGSVDPDRPAPATPVAVPDAGAAGPFEAARQIWVLVAAAPADRLPAGGHRHRPIGGRRTARRSVLDGAGGGAGAVARTGPLRLPGDAVEPGGRSEPGRRSAAPTSGLGTEPTRPRRRRRSTALLQNGQGAAGRPDPAVSRPLLVSLAQVIVKVNVTAFFVLFSVAMFRVRLDAWLREEGAGGDGGGGAAALGLLRELPLDRWQPVSRDADVLRDWMVRHPLSSTQHQLAVTLLSALNWGRDEERGRPYVGRWMHRRAALILVEAVKVDQLSNRWSFEKKTVFPWKLIVFSLAGARPGRSGDSGDADADAARRLGATGGQPAALVERFATGGLGVAAGAALAAARPRRVPGARVLDVGPSAQGAGRRRPPRRRAAAGPDPRRRRRRRSAGHLRGAVADRRRPRRAAVVHPRTATARPTGGCSLPPAGAAAIFPLSLFSFFSPFQLVRFKFHHWNCWNGSVSSNQCARTIRKLVRFYWKAIRKSVTS